VVIEDRGRNVKGLMNINVGGYRKYELGLMELGFMDKG
jgi:hypothetical protein